MKRFLVVSSIVILAHVQGVFSAEGTVQELLQRKDIVLEELAPALRIAVAENKRDEAIRAAVAVRDFSTLSALLHAGHWASQRELELIAVTAAEHGYQLFWHETFGVIWKKLDWLPVEVGIARERVYLPAFLVALRNGFVDVARALLLRGRVFFHLFNVLKRDELNEADKQMVIQFLSQSMPEFFESLEDYRPDQRDHEFRTLTKIIYSGYYRVLSHVQHDPELYVQLRASLLALYLRAATSVYPGFFYNTLDEDVMYIISRSLEEIQSDINVQDVLGVICEFLDAENGRSLVKNLEENT